MTLERRNPLPPGRYWQDIFEKQARDWDNWVHPKLADGSVTIERFEHFRADPLHDGRWLPGGPEAGELGAINARTWVLFNVVRPVEWPAVKLGFPTVADVTVQHSSDTAQNPPGPSPIDEIKEGAAHALDSAGEAVATAAKVAAGGFVVWLILKLILKR